MKKYLYLLTYTLLITSGCAYYEKNDPTSFTDTSWNLVELNDRPVQYTGARIPHMRFEADKMTGYDGCNNIFGDYTLDGNSLKFGMIASTRMACEHINGLDMEFHKMLSKTKEYRITGNRLELYEKENRLASFLAAVKN